MEASQQQKEYLWDHFKFNAEQRLKAFNFFVVFSVFANGGVFAAIEKRADAIVFVLVGAFICLLASTFFLIDRRSQHLLRLGIPGLKDYEKRFPEHSRLFALDEVKRERFVRYTVAFRVLFVAQLCFGLGVFAYGFGLGF